jgi:hypothetical protein
VIDTDRGLVIVSGCGHAGVVNTLEFARKTVRAAPVHAAVGGFHLFAADEATLDWTAGKLREMGVANLLGAHCPLHGDRSGLRVARAAGPGPAHVRCRRGGLRLRPGGRHPARCNRTLTRMSSGLSLPAAMALLIEACQLRSRATKALVTNATDGAPLARL